MIMAANNRKLTCLDFFAGSGLVSEGLNGFFETIWANDNCEKKAKVYYANHRCDYFKLTGIENIQGKDVPDASLSWGSFPCQDLSLAGNMGGLFSPRSGLVWQWLRVMDELQIKPPIAVAENVVGLVSSSKGENYRQLHQSLVDRGYKVGAVILDAVHWVPQSRKRVFIIAVDKNIPTTDLESFQPLWCHPAIIVNIARTLDDWVWWKLPVPQDRKVSLKELVDFEEPCDEPEKRDRLLAMIPENHMSKLELAVKNGCNVFPGYKRIRKGKQVLELRFDGIAGCLRTPEGGSSRQILVIHQQGELKTRLLTVRETAALMGAPQNYKLPGSYNDGYKAMGDAVAVPVARYLAQHLLAPLAARTK